MKKVNFNALKGSGGSWENVEELGIFKDLVAKGTQFWFGNKNFRNEKKRVTVLFKQPDEEEQLLTCSEDLSTIVRKAFANGWTKGEIMKTLVYLRVIENEVGLYLIPDSEAGEKWTHSDLVKGKAKSLETIANGKPEVLEDVR